MVLVLAFAVVSGAAVCGATFRVTTWNLEWFPNGKQVEAPPEEQVKRIAAAADVLRPLEPDVILLQEVKDYDACARLAEAIKPETYQVAICSAFKEPFQAGVGKQQVAILAKEPAQAAWSEPWKKDRPDPPRGFAFAWFKIRGADVALYSVHLKSNLIQHGDKDVERAKNIRKREIAITQLMSHVHEVIETTMPMVKTVIVGGDFNTNRDQSDFAAEKTLRTLPENGFTSCFGERPLADRVTHPRGHGYPDATFDYLFGRGGMPSRLLIIKSRASDHLPVSCDFETTIPPERSAEAVSEMKPTTSESPPTVVTIMQPVRIAVPYGQTVLPYGLKLPFISRNGSTVTVRYMGEEKKIPVGSTDIPR